MEEAFAVGKAKGVALDPAYLDDRMNFVVNKVEPGMKASMAHDLERGNRMELDWLAGKVRALGREFGIPTPASERSTPCSSCIAWDRADAGSWFANRARRFVAAACKDRNIAFTDLDALNTLAHYPRQELTPVPGPMAPA